MGDKAKPYYEKALEQSKLQSQLVFEEKTPTTKHKKKRSRNVIRFVPPYCSSLKTNIGEKFLKLLDKHFPVNSPLYKLFNRRTVKLNYSCSQNIKTIIQNHKKK